MNLKIHNETPRDFEKVYTLREVYSILHVGRVTVSRLLRGGKLRGFKVGRAWRIRREDLEIFMRPQIVVEQETARLLDSHTPKPKMFRKRRAS